MPTHEKGDLLACTVRINTTEGYRIEDERESLEGTIFEGMPGSELRGALYRHGVEEYGRCTGKVYIDRRIATNDEGGERWEVVPIGYVFVKRVKYDDCDETFLCETWLSLERVVTPAQQTIVESVAL